MAQKSNKASIRSKTAIDPNVKFQVTEAYKAIRTNIMYSVAHKGCKRIVISSSEENEGKSTSAVNIAISLAQTNLRVLLIDTDLRKSKIHLFFELNNAPGVTQVLTDMASPEEVIRTTSYANLDVITAGATPPNPSELLAGDTFAEWLDQLSERYDYIVIDTSPINVVSDALPVIKKSDGVVLMVRSGRTTYPALEKAVQSLQLIDAKILGCVLNGVDVQSRRYGKYGYGKYGYGKYGYGYGNTGDKNASSAD
jgi:capsular exopolysaccharide synthesis family protein